MILRNSGAEIFIPGDTSTERALDRTTHLGIGAHPDDLEIVAYHGILQSFQSEDNWFFGVTVTDGSGSPRAGAYANYSDEAMHVVRREEQKRAAALGEYGGVALLDYASAAVKDADNPDVVEDLKTLIEAAKPWVIYTHNLADKHDTHVAVALRTIEAVRGLDEESKPRKLYGCEAWRDLDWMFEADKVALDVGGHEELASSLLGVFESQIAGGKRYDLATLGRWRANATYHETHGTDTTSALIYAMDLTPLIRNPRLEVRRFVAERIDRFARDVFARLGEML